MHTHGSNITKNAQTLYTNDTTIRQQNTEMQQTWHTNELQIPPQCKQWHKLGDCLKRFRNSLESHPKPQAWAANIETARVAAPPSGPPSISNLPLLGFFIEITYLEIVQKHIVLNKFQIRTE